MTQDQVKQVAAILLGAVKSDDQDKSAEAAIALLSGALVNLARIADACEKVANHLEESL